MKQSRGNNPRTFTDDNMERYAIRDREAGNVIDVANDVETARMILASFEDMDREDGIYTPGFYEIYDRQKMEAVACNQSTNDLVNRMLRD